MNNDIIASCKSYINDGDLPGLQEYYNTVIESTEYEPNWQYIYHRVYLHACLKKKHAIAEWLTSLFSTFDEVSQIALRQIFAYGRYLLRR